MKVPTSLADAWNVLRQSPVSIPDTRLYFYYVLDMVGQPLSRKALLDQSSRLGAMRGRWYVTKRLPELEQESILKASAIPVYEMSAYTAKILSSYWLRSHKPFLSILPNDLKTALIDPFQQAVVATGVDIRLRHEVTGLRCRLGDRLDEVTVRTPGGSVTTMNADVVVVATPLDVTPGLIHQDVYTRDVTLGYIQHLRAAPMASLHLTLKHKLPGLPRDHVF